MGFAHFYPFFSSGRRLIHRIGARKHISLSLYNDGLLVQNEASELEIMFAEILLLLIRKRRSSLLQYSMMSSVPNNPLTNTAVIKITRG